MTQPLDRQCCIDLVNDAIVSGASLNKACQVLEVHPKTYRRWIETGVVLADGRPNAQRPTPSNKLTEEERELIYEAVNEYM